MLAKIRWVEINCIILFGASLNSKRPSMPFTCRDLAKAPRDNSHGLKNRELPVGSQGAAVSEAEEEAPIMDSGMASQLEGMKGVKASSHSKRMPWCQGPHAPRKPVRRGLYGYPPDSEIRRLFMNLAREASVRWCRRQQSAPWCCTSSPQSWCT